MHNVVVLKVERFVVMSQLQKSQKTNHIVLSLQHFTCRQS